MSAVDMSKNAKPFGNLATARLLIIGYDPRLQNSKAEAETALFFNYLTCPEPTQTSERRKYALAHGTWEYVS